MPTTIVLHATVPSSPAPPAAPVIWAVDASVWRDHPLGRGEFVAAVFSGSRSAIGEAAGQSSWATPLKFALPDPRCAEGEDFAGTSGAPLPRWPERDLHPAEGVCFVFADDRHPHLAALVGAGGREHEHFIVLSRPPAARTADARVDANLRELLGRAGDGPVVLLGYGDQGERIARRLRAVSPGAAHRALVIDAGPQRRLAAQNDGFATADQSAVPAGAGAVIYTPLERHAGLFGILTALERRGAAALRDPRGGGAQFIERGPYRLEPAAARVLEITDGRLVPRTRGLAVEAAVVRDDVRLLGGREVRHLHGMERFDLGNALGAEGLDLPRMSRDDRLSPATFIHGERAYIGLCGASPSATAPLGCFAGREFCAQFWPEAVERIFPAAGWQGLGATAFERRLRRYVSSRTVGVSLQSWAQQVLLGTVAAHTADAGAPIVEIGCATGGSTALMACATMPTANAAGAEIYTVDPDPAMVEINRFVAQQEGYAHRLRPITATSDDAIVGLRGLRERCALVFIDGDHSEAGVARDFDNYAGLVRPGGVLLFHDVSARDLGVLNVVIDRVLTDPRFALVCMVDTMAVFARRG